MTEVGSIFFDAELDDSGLVAATIKAAKRAAAEATVKFTADADFRGLAEKAALAARRAKAKIEFKADFDDTGLRSITRVVRRLGAGSDEVSGFTDSLDGLSRASGQAAKQTAGLATGMSRLGPAALVIGAAAAQAVPYVVALGAGLVMLAEQAVLAAAGLGVGLVTNVAALGVAAVTTKIGLTGLSAAFKAVSKAQKEQAKTGKISKATLKAQNAALKQLAPSARSFVKAVVSLQDEWKGLAKSVQGKLFQGLGKDVQRLGTTLLPVLKRGLGGIAGVLNDAADGFLRWASSSKGVKTISTILGGLKGILTPLVDAIGRFGGGLLTLFTGSLPFGKKLATAIDGIAKSFQTWAQNFVKTGGLKNFLDKAWTAAKRLWDILGNIASIIGSVFGGADKSGGDLLKTIDDVTKKWADWLKDPKNRKKVEQFFTDMSTNLSGIASALKTAGPSLQGFFDNMDKNAQSLDKIATAVEGLSSALGTITSIGTTGVLSLDWGKLLGGLKGFGPGIARALSAETFLGPIGQALSHTLGAALVQAGGSIGGAASALGKKVREGLTSAWSSLGADIQKAILTGLGPIGAAIVAAFTGTSLAGIATFVDSIGQLFVDLYNFLIGNSLIPDLVTGIIGWFATLPAGIAGAIGSLGSIFTTWVSGAVQAVTTTVIGIVTAFVGLAGRCMAAAGQLGPLVVTWGAGAVTAAGAIASGIVSRFVGLAGRAIGVAGSLAGAVAGWGAGAIAAAGRVASSIVAKFSGLAGRIERAIGRVTIPFVADLSAIPTTIHIRGVVDVSTAAARGLVAGSMGGFAPNIPPRAAGRITRGPEVALIGEKGPEAIVPLRRSQPLDPAVTALLSSVANSRGLVDKGGRDRPVVIVEEGASLITIAPPTDDPQALAMSVMNRLIATSAR